MTANPDSPHVGLVVEGRGDKAAVPILLRAHMHATGRFDDVLGKPVPCNGRGAATAPSGIEGYVAAAAARPGCRGVLAVLDCDADRACELGPTLQARGQAAVSVPVVVALAEQSYEDWIYASAETLEIGLSEFKESNRGILEIKSALSPVKYVKPLWQPRLTSRMQLELAKPRNRSLARMLEKFESLCARLPG